ncbi:MAG: homocysteine S-methyltransferase family protein [Pseudomonadota bacterium]
MTKKDIILLDGGMGQELIHRAGYRPTPLWSTQVMVDHPGMVADVHRAYFASGATVATTNTYAIHRDRLIGTTLEDDFAALHAAACKEAQSARRDGQRIAGAIGPLIASYRPDAHPPLAEAIVLYREIANLLSPVVDLILGETVASIEHGAAVLEGARVCGKPVWLAYTLDDEDGSVLRSGEPLSEAIAASTGAAAILVNCSAPEAIDVAMPILAQGGYPFGGYGNGFEQITKAFLGPKPTVDALAQRRDMGPAKYADHVMRWIGHGATIVGGCCEVGPDHIAEIAKRVTAEGHRIV